MFQLVDLYKRDSFDFKNKFEMLNNINLSFYNNGFTCFVGENDPGLDILFKILTGKMRQDSGEIIIDGLHITNKSSNINLYKKHAISSLNIKSIPSLMTVEGFLSSNSSFENELLKEKVASTVNIVNYNSGINRFIFELNSLDKYKILLAKGIIDGVGAIIIESLSKLSQDETIELLSVIKQTSQNTLVLLKTNNEELVNKFADRIIKIENSNVTYDSNPQTFLHPNDDSYCSDIYVTNSRNNVTHNDVCRYAFQNIRNHISFSIIAILTMSLAMASTIFGFAVLKFNESEYIEKLYTENNVELVNFYNEENTGDLSYMDIDRLVSDFKFGNIYSINRINQYKNKLSFNNIDKLNEDFSITKSGKTLQLSNTAVNIETTSLEDCNAKLIAGRLPTTRYEMAITNFNVLFY